MHCLHRGQLLLQRLLRPEVIDQPVDRDDLAPGDQ
jgi:hypothetical protein